MSYSVRKEEMHYGDEPLIAVAWRLGAELQFWSSFDNVWKDRAKPLDAPNYNTLYRIKPQETPWT